MRSYLFFTAPLAFKSETIEEGSGSLQGLPGKTFKMDCFGLFRLSLCQTLNAGMTGIFTAPGLGTRRQYTKTIGMAETK